MTSSIARTRRQRGRPCRRYASSVQRTDPVLSDPHEAGGVGVGGRDERGVAEAGPRRVGRGQPRGEAVTHVG
ncbi:MAG: hypothetical protein V9F04_13905 [Dermatophilaceae bacterium]